MAGFNFFGKLLVVLAFPVNLNLKYSILGEWQYSSFFICFLIFYRNYVDASRQNCDKFALEHAIGSNFEHDM